MNAPQGHQIRIGGSSAAITIRSNTFYSPIQYWGLNTGPGANSLMSRPDLVLVSPGHQINKNGSTNTAGTNGPALNALWWSASDPLTLVDLMPVPLHFIDNDIRYIPHSETDWFFGFNISENTSWLQLNTGHFYDYEGFCEALAEGSDCGQSGPQANRFHATDAAWLAADLPNPASYFDATFTAYRESLGLTLPDSRYQNALLRDRELDLASTILREKRRGNWSEEYDVYELLNFLRAPYGLSPITSPYAD
jgi:hypothetical protein